MFSKRLILISALSLLLILNLSAEEQASIEDAGKYAESLIIRAGSASGAEKRDLLKAAAELKSSLGEIDSAADLYEEASLAVAGNKDFDALYRSALLHTEMAHYRKAETLTRAISTFSDNSSLRIKSAVLTSRILALQDKTEQAYDILKNIISSMDSLPDYLAYWINDFYKLYSDRLDLSGLKKLLDKYDLKDYLDVNNILTPEFVFGRGDELVETIVESKENNNKVQEQYEAEENKESPVYIQLGSFSVRENAEDLLKHVKEKGFDAKIGEKEVNGKEYIVVYVPVVDMDNIQNQYIRLKEAGFEGYTVY